MDSAPDAQLFQVHTAYVAAFPPLVQHLVLSGSLDAKAGIELIRMSRRMLSEGPNEGPIIDAAIGALDATMAVLELRLDRAP